MGLRGGRSGPGDSGGLWGSRWDRGRGEALGSRWGQAGPGCEGPGPPRPVPSRPCRFCGPGKGCEPPVPPRPGGRRGWGRMGPAVCPQPAPAPQHVGSFVCGFPPSRGLGKCLFGERTVLKLVFKTAFFFFSEAGEDECEKREKCPPPPAPSSQEPT